MSKGPTPRHSKPSKPVVIDLDATDVTPKTEEPKPKSSATGPAVKTPTEPAKAAESELAKPAAAAASGMSASGKADPASKDDSATAGVQAKSGGDAKSAAEPKPSAAAAEAKAADAKTRRPDTDPARSGAAATAAAARSGSSGSDKKSGGGLGMVAAGVIGAIIALGGGYALQASGNLPVPGGGSGEVDVLTAKVDAISSDVQSLASQVASSPGTGGADIPADLTARLDALESSVADAAAGDGGIDPAVLDQLDERIAGLESRLTELGEAGSAAAADPAIASDLDAIRAAQSGLEASATDLRSELDALSDKIAGLEQGQAQLAQQVEAPSRQIDLARAIAAAGLKSAIDRGGSFMTELEAFASVAPDDPAVPELRDMAARGVPSRSDLVAGFSDAAATAIAAAEPVDPQAGLVDRLMSSALSVVKVRKVGDVEGDSAEAIAARAETRLLNGDLEAAVIEWNALPEISRTAAADFGDALAARARAEKLIATAMAPSGSTASSPSPSEVPAN